MSSSIRYAIVRFDDRNRYGRNGIPANLLFAGGQRVIVWMKDATRKFEARSLVIASSGLAPSLGFMDHNF